MFLNSLSDKIGQYTLVLLLLVITLILFPFAEGYPLGRLLLSGWCVLINAFLVHSLIGERMHRIQLIILATILIGCLFVYITGKFISKDVPGIGLWVLGLTILFLCYSIRIILSSIFSRKLFTADLISGAVLSYLLLGIAWGALNTLIETIFPGSFSFASDQDLQNKGSALVYHSFVTLTTLGYGEILPLTRITRTSAYLEAVAGVMYCAILVAGLISNIGRDDKP
jgi:hypothetical protein